MHDNYYHSSSKLAYDGELIDMQDAIYRLDRDKERQEKYREVENALDDEQATWSEIEEHLNR